MSENAREQWDTGEPVARSHEQYRKPETEEPQSTEVGPGNPPLVSEQDDGDVTDTESNEVSDGDAGDSDDSES